MSLHDVPIGTDVPNDINVIIEIPMNSPAIKYEVDKKSGTLYVDLGGQEWREVDFGSTAKPATISPPMAIAMGT